VHFGGARILSHHRSEVAPRARVNGITVYRDTLSEGVSHFVTSMTAPGASGWSGCRVGLAPTGKHRLFTVAPSSMSNRIQVRPLFATNSDPCPMGSDPRLAPKIVEV
jgi:hypothetical protein